MNSTHAAILGQLETRTEAFRHKLATKHRSRAAEARRAYGRAVDGWAEALAVKLGCDAPLPRATAESPRFDHNDRAVKVEPLAAAAVSSQKWHDQRARGQEARFAKIRNCGTRVRISHCRMCATDGKPVPEGCGVSRLCGRCSLANAKRRRGRFGRARARALLESAKAGVTRKRRRNGRYTEKMLTLTVPHVDVSALLRHYGETLAWIRRAVRLRDEKHEDAPTAAELRKARARLKACGELMEKAKGSTVKARVELLWDAWPRFRRALLAYLELAGETWTKIHRAFEWTPGADTMGHPHFHLWLWSPYLDGETISDMWTAAVLDAGAPEPEGGRVRVRIQMFRSFDARAATELLKGGKREALTLSRLYKGKGPGSAFDYADGWTIADVMGSDRFPDQIAALYEVLEGKRLTQASAGFFVDDPRAECPCCEGWGEFSIRFEHPRSPRKCGAPVDSRAAPRHTGTGPP